MGLWGADTGWQTDERLPEIPAEAARADDLERVVLQRSVDLQHARQRIVVAGGQLGFDRSTALVPEFHVGPLGEREEDGWQVGPTFEFPIPIFDQGQARIGRAAADLRRAQQEFYALAVRIRSTARAARDRLEGARDRALYYRDILLPLQERIVNESQLKYNAMQLGPIELLRAREQQIETAVAYIESMRDYWLARSDFGQILNGRLPKANGVPVAPSGEKMKMNGREGH
jgi:cobalt-zinc-cadmium efflux system outer membrane protein